LDIGYFLEVKIKMNLNWFYLHVALALIVLVKDYNGTLEGSLDRFEQKIGLYTPPDTTDTEDVPFYLPPIEEEVDSTFILPDRLKIKKENK
jgi:hypothetical protein